MKLELTPRKIDLSITTRCNLRCSYCSHFSSDGDVTDDLPAGEWLDFFDEMKECSVMEACLSGGEPLLREDLRELLLGIVRNRMRFSILSNGTLVDEGFADFIKSTGRCNSFQVSIDGQCPDVHDEFRGRGSFARALNGLRILLSKGIPATARVTIHKHNYKHLAEISRLLLEDVGLPSFSTNSASHLGLCRQNKESISLNVDEYSEAMASLLELSVKYNGRIEAQAGPLATGRHWLEMEEAVSAGRPGIPGCGYLKSCGGVYANMAVRADGMMVPCAQMPHIELGRMNRDSLREIWQEHPELKRMRCRRDIPLGNFEFCNGCRYVPYCRGGCPALAYTLTGMENVPNPEFDSCYREFRRQGGRLPKYPVNS